MKPDRTNYEIWLIDYLDGTLNSEKEKELFSFLNANPDIMEEFRDLVNYIITPSTVKFRNKSSLKKSPGDLSESQFELLCIAASENDINEHQKRELDEIISANPEKGKTISLINRIKLSPPPAVYRYKSRLKKLSVTQKIIRYSVVSISTAAAVFLLFTILRSPLPVLNDKMISLLPADTFQKENIAVNAPGMTSFVPPSLPPENVSRIVTEQDKTVEDMTKTESQPAVVSDFTDTISSSELLPLISIAKINYLSPLPLGRIETGQDLIAINIEPADLLIDEEKPGLNESIAKFIRGKILKSEKPEEGPLKGYEIADAGITGLNKLFGWELSLQKNVDNNGEVNSVYFNSRLLKFNAPVKKSESAE